MAFEIINMFLMRTFSI